MAHIDLRDLPKVVNPVYFPLLKNKDRYLVLMGGGGSGKSVFATQKLVYRLLTEKGHKILVVRKVGDTLRDSVFTELVNTISRLGFTDLFKIPSGRSSELYLKCLLNGNEVIFAGLDNVEKRKSIANITSMWIEEASELDVEDFRQLNIRLRTKTKHYLQMLITFNPISISHWLKAEFFDIKRDDATTMKTTYKDNKFLTKEAIKVLEDFKLTDPYFYMVYCLGEWGVLGKTVFNAEIVTGRLAEIRGKRAVKYGYFAYNYVDEQIVDESIHFVETEPEDAYITIYEEPKEGYPYVGGGDTSGEGSDAFAMVILNNITGIQAAVLHHEHDEDLYARQCYCIGKYYGKLSYCNGDALLSIETNFSTFPVKELTRLGYHRQMNREVQDTFTGKVEKRYGFRTDKLSRPMLIGNLVKIVREHVELFNDIRFLEECLSFVRNEKGRAEAQEGKHDDLIMSTGIAFLARDQGYYSIKVEKEAPKLKLADKLGLNKKRRRRRFR